MKKKFGGLLLTLGALVISAACATAGASSRTKQPQAAAEPGENWAKAASTQPGFTRPAR